MTVFWGILGAGKIAERQMAPAIAAAPGHELAAVMRRDPAAAQQFVDAHGAQRAYDDEQTLLADPQVNAVYVATPPHLHARQTIMAARAGKHILCEKPMALSSGEARQMIEAARANGVMLTICHYQRFNARHQRVKALLEAGAIGQVTAARINFSERFAPQPGVWQHDPAVSGGGPIMDLGIHCIDLLRYLCGAVESVAALVDTLVDDSAVEDTATLLLRLTGGAQAVITSHWTTANHDPERFNGLEIGGTEGTIMAAPIQAKDSAGMLKVISVDGTHDFSIDPGGQRPHVALLNAFADAVAGDKPNPIAGEEGLAGLAVVEAAHESARSGRRIVLDDPSSQTKHRIR